MASLGNEMIVVAIDFGTTFSGYAYSFKSDYNVDPKRICANSWGRKTDNINSQKTPTCILLKCKTSLHDFEEVAFGYDAEDQYLALVDEEDDHDHVLANKFKMDLYSESAESGLKEFSTVQLPNGNHIMAMRLYSMFIKYIRKHFLKAISERGIYVKETDVRWVLTVPAIWTEGAKQLMRKAAEQAGIEPSQLTIAYEPEAAALYCMQVTDPTEEIPKAMMEVGCRYLVVDAGGGTVDFTVCEVSDTKRLDVYHEATGGPWGGTNVEKAFTQTLADLFGQDVFERFSTEHREELSGLIREFEYKKRTVRDDQKQLTFRLPLSLCELYSDQHHMQINEECSRKFSDKITIVRDKMRIHVDLFKEYFEQPTKNVVGHIKQLLRERQCADIKIILLVGGFGSSKFLQQSIRDKFPEMTLIIPEDPEMAVVKGAVLFGHDPAIVKTRIARFSYGISTVSTFKEGEHSEDRKKIIDGKAMCEDVFSVHVARGQILHTGEPEPAQTYKPLHADQTSIIFRVFASTEEHPSFVTDDSCKYIGELIIDMPDTREGKDRPVLVELSFGETEILVKAVDEKTKRNVSVSLNLIG